MLKLIKISRLLDIENIFLYLIQQTKLIDQQKIFFYYLIRPFQVESLHTLWALVISFHCRIGPVLRVPQTTNCSLSFDWGTRSCAVQLVTLLYLKKKIYKVFCDLYFRCFNNFVYLFFQFIKYYWIFHYKKKWKMNGTLNQI